MSPDADRIAVPTNGRGPHPAGPAATPPGPSATDGRTGRRPVRRGARHGVLAGQLAVGFGIVASLVVLLAGWARRRRSGG